MDCCDDTPSGAGSGVFCCLLFSSFVVYFSSSFAVYFSSSLRQGNVMKPSSLGFATPTSTSYWQVVYWLGAPF